VDFRVFWWGGTARGDGGGGGRKCAGAPKTPLRQSMGVLMRVVGGCGGNGGCGLWVHLSQLYQMFKHGWSVTRGGGGGGGVEGKEGRRV